MAFRAKSRISAVLPHHLTVELRQISLAEHIPQSRVLEDALGFWLQHRLEADVRELSKLTFDDLPSEDEWLSLAPTA